MTPALASDRRVSALVIGGPTASGKSLLALELARRHRGVVINADSMQVYRELSILTARPGERELAVVPHRLYGVLPASERCSAARWAAMARAEIAAAARSGWLPILVGGTGLYLRALMRGLAPVPEIPAAIRAAATDRLRTLGSVALHDELARRDPDSAARLPPSDTQRILRHWEVLEATGRPLTRWQREAPAGPDDLRFETVVLLPPRQALYAACDARFMRMLDRGALEEVRLLAALGLPPDRPVMKAVGVPELMAFLGGALPWEAAIARGRQATRRYAKRQITWFRHQLPVRHALEQMIADEGEARRVAKVIAPRIIH